MFQMYVFCVRDTIYCIIKGKQIAIHQFVSSFWKLTNWCTAICILLEKCLILDTLFVHLLGLLLLFLRTTLHEEPSEDLCEVKQIQTRSAGCLDCGGWCCGKWKTNVRLGAVPIKLFESEHGLKSNLTILELDHDTQLQSCQFWQVHLYSGMRNCLNETMLRLQKFYRHRPRFS